MLSKKNIIDYLLDQDKLWDGETKHEAMLLYKSLYKNSPENQERLIDYIFEGPPLSRGRNSKDDERYKERKIFEILQYLQDDNLELSQKGKNYLNELKIKYPQWKIDPDVDIESPIHVEWRKSPFHIEDIRSNKPKDIAKKLKDFEESTERDQYDFCTAVGKTCRQDPDWALQLFEELNLLIDELPINTISYIIWSMQTTDKGDMNIWDLVHIQQLLNILHTMIFRKSEAELWSSLPGLLKNWQKNHNLDLKFWDDLTEKLAIIFKSFDNEKEKSEDPVEWIERAINHPYGDLAELYLAYAYQMFTNKQKEEAAYVVDPRIIRFLEFTTNNYDLGTRYGLCIICRWLPWLEDIVPEWTHNTLIPTFSWNNNDERTLIAWSGYLASRVISRNLSEHFDYFLNTARNYNKFGNEEKKGLVAHVSALIWFKNTDILNLKKFVFQLDRKGRMYILEMWQQHLLKSENTPRETFWNTIIIPYWNWCENQRYLDLPDGNEERFKFWELIPFANQVFPQAAKMAIRLCPSEIDNVHLFHKNLIKATFSISYPEEFTEFLLEFIKKDRNPSWYQNEWRQLWESLKNSGAKNLNNLRGELSKDKILEMR